jgi:hypothetical protein
MIIPKELFNEKDYDKAMDKYLKGLYGIKITKKAGKKGANKEKQRAKRDCACDDVTDKKD